MLYNAECDSLNPKSLAQLRSELRVSERAWRKKPTSGATKLMLHDGTSEEFDKVASDYSKYLFGRLDIICIVGKKNADHFNSLIDSVKKRNKPS